MYHIKNDQRAKRSAKTIYKTLLALMQSQSFETIKVSDIVRHAEIGRSTFYRNFDEIEDVLRLRCDEVFDALLTYIVAYQTASAALSTGALLTPVLRYFYLHSDIIELLLQANRMDIFHEAFRNRSQAIQAQFAKQLQIPPTHVAYLAEVRISVLIAIVTQWVKTGKREAPDALAETLRGLLNSTQTVGQLV